MAERGLLIVVAGPSGVGKDTVLEAFLKRSSTCVKVVSATTRPPRQGERDGVDYHFITRERFEAIAGGGGMLEHMAYNGNYYGSPKEEAEKLLGQGKNVILKIEVKGALEVKRQIPDTVLIFLMPPSWRVLRERLENRGTESPKAVEERLAIAKYEIETSKQFDFIVVNDNFERCLEQLGAVIEAESCRARLKKCFLEEVLSDAEAVHVSDN